MPGARFSSKEIDNLYATLRRLGEDADHIARLSLYEGAGVMADAVREKIDTIRSDGPSEWETSRRERQKQGLRDGLSISPMRIDSKGVSTLVGFDGYNEDGQANKLVARVFNSGTSFSSKQPFFESAVEQTRSKARKKIIEKMEKEFENTLKE